MKYLFINQSSFEKGGVSTLALHFLKYESDCIFLNLNSDSTYSSRNREFFLSWEESHHPETVSNIILLIFKIYPEEPFIIIPNYGHIAHVASALALLQNDKCRMLGICHNNQDATFELLKSFSPVFSHYLAVSKWVKNKLLHTLNKKNVSHIYPITIKSSVSSSINHTRPLRLIYVSRLTNVDKNALRLIPMIKGFIKSNFDFTLDIFGDGPCYFELESFINDLSLGTSKIILHGDASHSAVQKSFKDSDILISLSSREGFGMAIAEAMGAKVVPLIMRFDGGICELLENGKNSILVNQEDYGDLIAQLKKLDKNRELLDKIKCHAHKTISYFQSPHNFFLKFREISLKCFLSDYPTIDIEEVKRLDPMFHACNKMIKKILGLNIKKVNVFGGGFFGRRVVDEICRYGIDVVCIYDSSLGDKNISYKGIKYYAPRLLCKNLPIIVCSLESKNEIINTLQKFDFPTSKIISL